jgi:hypothetical protein
VSLQGYTQKPMGQNMPGPTRSSVGLCEGTALPVPRGPFLTRQHTLSSVGSLAALAAASPGNNKLLGSSKPLGLLAAASSFWPFGSSSFLAFWQPLEQQLTWFRVSRCCLTMATVSNNKPGSQTVPWSPFLLAHTMYHHSHFLRSKIRRTSFLADKLMGWEWDVWPPCSHPRLSSRHPGNSGLMKSHNNRLTWQYQQPCVH